MTTQTQSNENQTRLIDVTKKIGDFKISFKTRMDDTQQDYLFLDVTVSPEFKTLLKEASISALTDYQFYGNDSTRKRYKAKTWIYEHLSGNFKNLLFDKDIIDNGFFSFPFLMCGAIDTATEEIKYNMKRITEVITRYVNYSTTITLNVEARV